MDLQALVLKLEVNKGLAHTVQGLLWQSHPCPALVQGWLFLLYHVTSPLFNILPETPTQLLDLNL